MTPLIKKRVTSAYAGLCLLTWTAGQLDDDLGMNPSDPNRSSNGYMGNKQSLHSVKPFIKMLG